MEIRNTSQADHEAIFALYPQAFPEEDLLGLVADLLASPQSFSLVTEKDSAIVGHIGFTSCTVASSAEQFSMLAPLAVAPDHQKQGIGKALIAHGIARLRADKVAKLLVLGDPNYYGLSGFTQETAITTPHPMPRDWATAWQSLQLDPSSEAGEGVLRVPDYWDRADYWS